MDILRGDEIAAAHLSDWRKLAQGLHARFLLDDFAAGAQFLAAVADAGASLAHHPRVSLVADAVDLTLISQDAVYREADGTEHVVAWVTQIELGLDAADSARIAPVWAQLLTGSAEAQGHGSPSDEIRDVRGRVPNLWFGDRAEGDAPGTRLHLEIYLAPEVVRARIDAAVAAGAEIVDDSDSPGLTVLADQEGNRAVICADVSAATGL
ncbi:VOC family protein [Brachybacterium saurashtrense]|uniref:Putative pterin-4-alpha-carbinolamine dehydratase n=1 Tax=Brachybacterium saurashtrense TaxID=556288 RepID=A0A345YME4_9MICO|nr:VOC family protein [Brachybacterium saurashtrense]AXK45096.1 4a-hydroxytetrahydrobiopterin dehydratase [Brachybacterium saurashtrense]RRR21780.1 4a-hydroxytetrahydrobiopterin dehydratase [Brachybacterium saurashtrense]